MRQVRQRMRGDSRRSRLDRRHRRWAAVVVLAAAAISLGPAAGSASASQAVLATIPLSQSGGRVAVDSTLNRVYVTNQVAGTATIIDGASNAVLGTFPSIPGGLGLAVNSQTGRIYVSDYGHLPAHVGVFDSAGVLLANVDTDPSFDLVVNEVTNKVYAGVISAFGGGRVSVIDGTTNAFSTLNVPGPSDAIAVNESTNILYTAYALCCGHDVRNGIRAFDAATGTLVASRLSESDFYFIAVDETHNKLYASRTCCSTDIGLHVLDGSTLTEITSLPFGGAADGRYPGMMAVDSQRNRLYVAQPFNTAAAGDLTVVDTTADTVVDTVHVGGVGSAIAVNETTGLVYVLDTGGTLHVVGESTGPVDVDADGIDDSIDTGTGTFQDGGTTAGTVGAVPAGYTVTVTDLPDPDGVRMTVSGTGTQKVTFTLTNPASGAPCGTLKLGPGSDVEATCGSITVHVVSGSAEIPLSDDTSLIVDNGETATVVISTTGTFVVQSVTGGDGKVTLVAGGVSTPVGGSSSPINLWDFVGFDQPVDNSGVYNVAKPGSNIPLKWRLLSETGAPITNLASASVSVTAIGCQGGAASDQIEEVAPSASGLQNQGNGNYQLNWKTDKNWTGCKQLRLSLQGEGPIVHTALFTFK